MCHFDFGCRQVNTWLNSDSAAHRQWVFTHPSWRMFDWNTGFTMQLVKRKLRVLSAKLLSRQANPLTFHNHDHQHSGIGL